MSDQTLIIGGDHDGEWISIRHDPNSVLLPNYNEFSGCAFKLEQYDRRLILVCPTTKKTIRVYVHDSLSDEAAWVRLLENYRPNKADAKQKGR